MSDFKSYSLGTLNYFTDEYLNEIISSMEYDRETKRLATRILNSRKKK